MHARLTRRGYGPAPARTPGARRHCALVDGRSALYDFTDNQTRNQLRFQRILVRGSHGEPAIEEAAETGRTVTTTAGPWA